MASKKNTSDIEQAVGWFYFAIFAILIIAGIFVKRVLDHPEFIMFFHLPAAVFLILSGYKIPKVLKERYQQDCLNLKQRSKL